MEIINITDDFTVYCLTASSFPEGIPDVHRKLHSLVPASNQRAYFGISRPDASGTITYKAAVGELEGENLSLLQLEKFTIPKGNYLLRILHNYMNDAGIITRTFDELIKDSRIHPQGFCLERYVSQTELHCLVPLK